MIEAYAIWIIWVPVALLVVYLGARGRAGIRHTFGVLLLTTYAFWIASVTFFIWPAELLAGESRGGLASVSVNLIPFRNLWDSFAYLSPSELLRQHGGNFLLLAPFTLLGPALWRRLRSWKMALVVGAGASLAIELLQLFFSGVLGAGFRTTDVDDLLLNTAGALFGYALFVGGRAVFRRARRGAQAEAP